MNIGAFGENFPYTNFHDLNLDWVINKVREFAEAVQNSEREIDEVKAEVEELLNSIGIVVDSKVEQAIADAIESGEFEEIIAAVANENIYYCVYPDMTQTAIQNAINEHTAIKFTPGTYRVYIPEINGYGYTIPSNRLIFFDDATILRIGATDHEYDSVITIGNSESNIKMYGNGTINYNREIMQIATGEHGMCLSMGAGCSNISIVGLKFINAFGDGIYINNVNNVYINNVVCNNNRRNAISVISGQNITVENSIFSNSNGTAPQAGIAIETNNTTDILKNITFHNCKCIGNAAERDAYITIFSDEASIKLDNLETENTITVLLRCQHTVVTIQNCFMKTKADSDIFRIESGANNTIIFDGCNIDGRNGAYSLIGYTGSVFENVYIINTLISDCTLTGRAVLAQGTREDVGNIIIDLITKGVTINDPVMMFRSARTNPLILWSIENSVPITLPASTPLVFNNYVVSQETLILATDDYIKQKIRIKNIGENTVRLRYYNYDCLGEASSYEMFSGQYIELIPYKKGEYSGMYNLTPTPSTLSEILETQANTIMNNTITLVNTVTIPTTGGSFTLPNAGVYLITGYGSVGLVNSIAFIIGGYATASRCRITNLTGQTGISIDGSDASALTFAVTNGSSSSVDLKIFKMA